MITIKPDEKFCDYIDNVMITGFKQSEGYFIIQRDDDDATNFYIELDDQGQSCYNGIKKITINDDKIIFELNPEGQANLDTDVIQIVDTIKVTQLMMVS